VGMCGGVCEAVVGMFGGGMEEVRISCSLSRMCSIRVSSHASLVIGLGAAASSSSSGANVYGDGGGI